MMKPSQLVYFDIDTQFDFMHPEGQLYVPGAETLTEVLQALLQHAHQHQIPVLASADAHEPDDPEFATFPPHCVKNTAGQRKLDLTHMPGAVTVPAQGPCPDLSQTQAVVLEKTVFDVFGNPHTEAILASLGAQEAVVFGVATDYCVKAAALGLKQRGYQVTVVTDAIKAVTPAGEQAALQAFAEAGITLATSSDILRRQP